MSTGRKMPLIKTNKSCFIVLNKNVFYAEDPMINYIHRRQQTTIIIKIRNVLLTLQAHIQRENEKP